MGEIDPLGTGRERLDAFLDPKVKEGYVIETRADTHAIIWRRPKVSDALRAPQTPDGTWLRSTKMDADDASGRAATQIKRYLSLPGVMDILGYG